jgi:hypothetical protein
MKIQNGYGLDISMFASMGEKIKEAVARHGAIREMKIPKKRDARMRFALPNTHNLHRVTSLKAIVAYN